METLISLVNFVKEFPFATMVSVAIIFPILKELYDVYNKKSIKEVTNTSSKHNAQTDNNLVKAKITQRKAYGLFVELPSGISGLIHVSNLHSGKKTKDYFFEDSIYVEETLSNKEGKYAFKAVGVPPQTINEIQEELVKNGTIISYYKESDADKEILCYISKDEQYVMLYNTLYKKNRYNEYISRHDNLISKPTSYIEIKNKNLEIYTKEKLAEKEKSKRKKEENDRKVEEFNRTYNIFIANIENEEANFSGIGKCISASMETYSKLIRHDPNKISDIQVSIFENSFLYDGKLHTVICVDGIYYIKHKYVRDYGYSYDSKSFQIKFSSSRSDGTYELISNTKNYNTTHAQISSIKTSSSSHSSTNQKFITNINKKEMYRNIPIFLRTKEINKFYHFTDIKNLDSIIEQGGLYSWAGLEKENIEAHLSSNELSRQLDVRYNLEDYVRLSFVDYHPMSTRVEKNDDKKLIWLEIDLDVALWESTLFSDKNATDNNVKFDDSFDFLKTLDFSIFRQQYNNLDYLGKKKYQAEILVKDFLPIKYIKNIDELKEKYLDYDEILF